MYPPQACARFCWLLVGCCLLRTLLSFASKATDATLVCSRRCALVCAGFHGPVHAVHEVTLHSCATAPQHPSSRLCVGVGSRPTRPAVILRLRRVRRPATSVWSRLRRSTPCDVHARVTRV